MSSTSQKHKDFVAEPMGEKSVFTLAGIGETLGKRLEDKGFDKVSFVYIQHVDIVLIVYRHGVNPMPVHYPKFLFCLSVCLAIWRGCRGQSAKGNASITHLVDIIVSSDWLC